MPYEPTVNVVDAITAFAGFAVTASMTMLRWRRGLRVLDDARITTDLLNGVTLVHFAKLTTTVFYPKILEEIAKSPLFATVAGLLAIIRVLVELFNGVEQSDKKR